MQIFFFFFFTHIYFPASGQAVVTSVVPSPPRFLPSILIAHRVQQSHCSSIFHRVLLLKLLTGFYERGLVANPAPLPVVDPTAGRRRLAASSTFFGARASPSVSCRVSAPTVCGRVCFSADAVCAAMMSLLISTHLDDVGGTFTIICSKEPRVCGVVWCCGIGVFRFQITDRTGLYVYCA